MTCRRAATLLAFLSAALLDGAASAGTLVVEQVLTGGQARQPVQIVSPPGDDRLFLVQNVTGRLVAFDPGAGTTADEALLRVPPSSGTRRRFLSAAFAPDFQTSGHVYASFTTQGDQQMVVRYTVDPADPGTVLAGSERVVLSVPRGADETHPGGWIGFGPTDGHLYVAFGEGDRRANPDGAQDVSDFSGNIFRIDPSRDDFPDDEARNYAIPADNPFANQADPTTASTYAYGLRHPWRMGFDEQTGQLFIGDVGEDDREEVNLGVAGANYGWPAREGSLATGFGVDIAGPGVLTDPVYEYAHGDGPLEGSAVTGGFVQRGEGAEGELAALSGRYVFADLGGTVFALSLDGDEAGDVQAWSLALADGTTVDLGFLVALGSGPDGALYLVDYVGGVFRVVGTVVPLPGAVFAMLTGLGALAASRRFA